MSATNNDQAVCAVQPQGTNLTHFRGEETATRRADPPAWPARDTCIERFEPRLAPSLPVDLNIFLGAAVRHREHHSQTDQDDDADHAPRVADVGKDAEFPECGQNAANQDDETYQVHACPLHADLLAPCCQI